MTDETPIERNPLALAMLAAWVNVKVDQLPKELRALACPYTMTAWKRVGDAAIEFHKKQEKAQ